MEADVFPRAATRRVGATGWRPYGDMRYGLGACDAFSGGDPGLSSEGAEEYARGRRGVAGRPADGRLAVRVRNVLAWVALLVVGGSAARAAPDDPPGAAAWTFDVRVVYVETFDRETVETAAPWQSEPVPFVRAAFPALLDALKK